MHTNFLLVCCYGNIVIDTVYLKSSANSSMYYLQSSTYSRGAEVCLNTILLSLQREYRCRGLMAKINQDD